MSRRVVSPSCRRRPALPAQPLDPRRPTQDERRGRQREVPAGRIQLPTSTLGRPDPVREQARLDPVGHRVAVDAPPSAVRDERGEGARLLLGRAAGQVVGRERRPIARTHDPDHRAVRGVGEQAVGRIAHRQRLAAVVGDGDPAAQPPATEQADARPTSRHAGTGASAWSNPCVLEVRPEGGRDGMGERLHVALLLRRRRGARDDRGDRRMPQRELERRRRQRHAVGIAHGGEPSDALLDLGRRGRRSCSWRRRPRPWRGCPTGTVTR